MRHLEKVPEMKTRFKRAYQYFDPVFFGLETQDLSKPALFVGNHTLYGVLDVPFLISEIYQQHHVIVRSLGDKFHFSIPGWREYLTSHGLVLGTPENCHELMQNGESILVFPGGAREVMRRKHEKYSLIWKKRTGFARLAIAHGYDIIPFASLGADDCFDIVYDANDMQKNVIFKQLLKIPKFNRFFRNGDVLPPLVRGIGPFVFPRPQRFYFSFGKRIPTTGLQTDQDSLWRLREQVASSIETQISDLKSYRAQDTKQWSTLRKVMTSTR
jgi:1-acyl-sn-glycerol-3-phosphate acyltransferase